MDTTTVDTLIDIATDTQAAVDTAEQAQVSADEATTVAATAVTIAESTQEEQQTWQQIMSDRLAQMERRTEELESRLTAQAIVTEEVLTEVVEALDESEAPQPEEAPEASEAEIAVVEAPPPPEPRRNPHSLRRR